MKGKHMLKRFLIALALIGVWLGSIVAVEVGTAQAASYYMGQSYDISWGVQNQNYCSVPIVYTPNGSRFCDYGFTLKPYPGTTGLCYRRNWYGWGTSGTAKWGIYYSAGSWVHQNGSALTYVC
jgi:hypothetical protein